MENKRTLFRNYFTLMSFSNIFPKIRVGVLKWLKRAFLLEILSILVDLNREYLASYAHFYSGAQWARYNQWSGKIETQPYE